MTEFVVRTEEQVHYSGYHKLSVFVNSLAD